MLKMNLNYFVNVDIFKLEYVDTEYKLFINVDIFKLEYVDNEFKLFVNVDVVLQS